MLEDELVKDVTALERSAAAEARARRVRPRLGLLPPPRVPTALARAISISYPFARQIEALEEALVSFSRGFTVLPGQAVSGAAAGGDASEEA